jgi:hypothetical protein
MIDFRYHLVSLVSVFLALAVGIVLGAGPLKDTIGKTITEDAASLRQQTASLRSQLDTSESGIAHRDDFITAVTPGLVTGQLGGHSVVLVLLPGADTAMVKPLVQSLSTAGARVTGQVSIRSTWTDPVKQAFRDQLVGQLQASVLGLSGTAATTNEKLSTFLARALVTSEISQAQHPDVAAQTLLKGLSAAGLVAVDGEVRSPSTEAVLIAPAVDTAGSVTSSGPVVDTASTFREMAITLDGACAGSVAVGPASSARSTGVLAAIRADSGSARAVSTVDTGGTPMGVVTTVLALREQLSGGAGSYGFGDGAKSPLPAPAGAS